MKEQLLSAVCVYAAQFVGRNRFYLIIKACMNHEFSMSGDFRHFLSPIRCFCSLFRRMSNISFLTSALCIPDPSDFMGRQFHAPSEAGKQKFVCIYNIHNLIFVQRKKTKIARKSAYGMSHMLIKLLTTETSDVHPLQQLH